MYLYILSKYMYVYIYIYEEGWVGSILIKRHDPDPRGHTHTLTHTHTHEDGGCQNLIVIDVMVDT